jgi:exodeoxyribonuclease-3
MIIASFNVNSIRARLPVLEKWFKKIQPEVLCIQETKVTDTDFPVKEINSFGYEAVYMGEKSYNGVAVLSKIPIEKVFYGFDGKGRDEGTRLISVKINGINIINTYIPQGTSPESEKFQYKLKFFSRLKKYFSSKFSDKDILVWTGDFNVAPIDIDVHDPKRLYGHVGFHPDEHKALEKVKASGFTDIFRKYHPEPGHYTFFDYRVRDCVARGLGWRVDHIWANNPALLKTRDSWIDKEPRLFERPSDHTPILAKFDFE